MEKHLLDKTQRLRYSRSLMLPYFDEDKQTRLLNSRVLIIGAGALGSIVSMYLAASGVGKLTIVDFDKVDLSNLQRQLSFSMQDIGQLKTEATARRISDINPEIEVTTLTHLLTANDASKQIPAHDLVIEGSDNPATKYMISNACVHASTPYVLGGISASSGQVMSFAPGHASYSDWFPEQGCGNGFAPCAAGGILGPVPGVIGSLMATEAVKILTGVGSPLFDRMLNIDTLTMSVTVLKY